MTFVKRQKARNRGHHSIKLSRRHHERVLVSVLGIGHSDIRGLATAGQWSAGSATVSKRGLRVSANIDIS